MFLLAILLSLILESFVPALDRLRSVEWFHRYAAACRRRLLRGARGGSAAVLAIVLPPVLLLGGLQYLLDEMLWLLSFLLSLVVLVFAMGPRDPRRLVRDYLAAREAGEEARLAAVLSALLPYRPPHESQARDEAVLDMVFILTHERLLAVFFWFVILGPMGAILYRLVSELVTVPPEDANADYWLTATRLHMVLAWLPAHLSALSFAVMGSFVHALQAWREAVRHAPPREQPLLPVCDQYVVRTGRAALQLEHLEGAAAVHEALALCQRSLIAWVTVLALLTLTGWVF